VHKKVEMRAKHSPFDL